MDMTRNNLIRDILSAFDTIDQLRFDNRMLRERIAVLEGSEAPQAETMGLIEHELVKMARKEVLKKGMGYWHSVRVDVDGDTGEIAGIQSYEDWLRNSLSPSNLPSWLSLDGYKAYFEDDLREVYQKERETALADIHNEGV